MNAPPEQTPTVDEHNGPRRGRWRAASVAVLAGCLIPLAAGAAVTPQQVFPDESTPEPTPAIDEGFLMPDITDVPPDEVTVMPDTTDVPSDGVFDTGEAVLP